MVVHIVIGLIVGLSISFLLVLGVGYQKDKQKQIHDRQLEKDKV